MSNSFKVAYSFMTAVPSGFWLMSSRIRLRYLSFSAHVEMCAGMKSSMMVCTPWSVSNSWMMRSRSCNQTAIFRLPREFLFSWTMCVVFSNRRRYCFRIHFSIWSMLNRSAPHLALYSSSAVVRASRSVSPRALRKWSRFSSGWTVSMDLVNFFKNFEMSCLPSAENVSLNVTFRA